MKDIVRLESITQVHNFLGIQKPKHPLISVIPIDEKMINAEYGDITWVLDFYQISLKSGLKGKLTYGRNSYDFEEGTMAFMRPGQTMKVESSEEMEGNTGWTLLFHPDLLRKSALGRNIDDYSFFSYASNEALHLSDDEQETVTELVNKIEKEYNQIIDKHSQTLIISNIELLLNYCKRFYDRQFYTRTNLNQDYVSKFEDMLEMYFDSNRHMEAGIPTVSFCGEEMNMSGHYLSDLLKKETGMSAQEHIHQLIINKAKNLLLSTNDTVSQIAYDLGFEYPQHFSKIFKSKTGVSPAAYRKAG